MYANPQCSIRKPNQSDYQHQRLYPYTGSLQAYEVTYALGPPQPNAAPTGSVVYLRQEGGMQYAHPADQA